jgi:N-acetyl sugar amidotransferase
MKYCVKCLYPSTKPELKFSSSGLCSACFSYEKRSKIDWVAKEKQFAEIVKKYKKKNAVYDCIIPVSGGKDSTYQALKAAEYNLKPLCVNSTTCDLSALGRKNLDNIKKLGFDVIEYSPNQKIRKKLNKLGLEIVGDISWPEHVGMFTIPITVAKKMGIGLILWGENSQNEYGGPLHSINSDRLDRRWLEEFGGMNGLRVEDLINSYGFKKKDLLPYIYEKKPNKIIGYFLGHFFPWDGKKNAEIAKKKNFKYHHKIVEGTCVKYENLDNYQTGIHDYFKYLKYGFGRTTDIVSLMLRRKEISRSQGIYLIKKYDGKYPKEYLDKPLKKILHDIDMTIERFNEICNQFTNPNIFKTNKYGKVLKDKNGNLILKNKII